MLKRSLSVNDRDDVESQDPPAAHHKFSFAATKHHQVDISILLNANESPAKPARPGSFLKASRRKVHFIVTAMLTFPALQAARSTSPKRYGSSPAALPEPRKRSEADVRQLEQFLADQPASGGWSLSLIVSVFGALAILLVGLGVWGTVYYYSNAGIAVLHKDVHFISLQQVRGAIETLMLESLLGVNSLAEGVRLFLAHGGSLTDYDSIQRIMFPLAQQFAPSLYMGFEYNGDFICYSRVGINNSYALVRSNGNLEQLDWTIDAIGNPLVNTGRRPYDARARPWYIASKSKKLPVFSDVYAFTRTTALGITPALPLFADLEPPIFFQSNSPKFVKPRSPLPLPLQFREVIAVFAADITLEVLSEFLETVPAGKTGSLFVLDHRGFLLGTSESARIGSDLLVGSLTHSTTISDPEFSEALSFLLELAGVNRSNATDFRIPEVLDARIGSLTLSSSTLVVEGQLGWHIILLIPEADYLAAPRNQFGVAVAVMLLLVLVMIVLIFFLSRFLTKPLGALERSMYLLTQRLDFSDDEVIDYSLVKEIRAMQDSYTSMRGGLKSFARYAPMSIVQMLLTHQSEAILGVDSGEAVSFFSDIEGFTAITERSHPSDLISVLAIYFEAMSHCIADYEGTFADTLGDSIFAFWNAPSPISDPCMKACYSALQQQTVLRLLRKQWKVASLPELKVRMGLSVGMVLMGNVGSPDRLKYTLIGDEVNLASRLEGLNKMYGTYILISEELYDRVKTLFCARAIDVVTVVGKKRPCQVYELMAARESAMYTEVQLEKLSLEMLPLYKEARWVECLEVIERILELKPDDAAITVIRDRVLTFQTEGTPDEWRGVTKINKK